MVDMIETVINGNWTLMLPEHRAARPHWYTVEGWERERLDAMYATIRPGDTVVDVGAEEGDMTALCAQWAGPDGRVVAVEPNPKVWPNLRAIWEANDNLAPIVDWFVGFCAATTDLDPPLNNIGILANDTGGWPACAFGPVIGDHGFRHLAQEADATPRIKLDDLLNGRDVDVITMDVEGSELEVLYGARDTLSAQHPTVFVSVHPEFMHDLYGQHPDELHTYMAGLGYRSQHLATDHEIHYRFTQRTGK